MQDALIQSKIREHKEIEMSGFSFNNNIKNNDVVYFFDDKLFEQIIYHVDSFTCDDILKILFSYEKKYSSSTSDHDNSTSEKKRKNDSTISILSSFTQLQFFIDAMGGDLN